jgi:5-methylcytosine-specific restriction endonuclease McrA
MPAPRRKWSVTDKLHVLVKQARCPLCGERLGLLAECDFDHEVALVKRGEDSIDNLRAVHRECHKVKTFGRGGERRISTRDSDISEPKRLDRISEKHMAFQAQILAPAPREDRPRSKWGKRKFQSRKKT